MTLDEWEEIAAWMGALFPNFNGDEATIVAYHHLLAEHDVRDVEAAARYLVSQPDRRFFPSVGEVIGQAQTEARVRMEHDRLPDFTGVHALPEPEREQLHERGLAASAEIPGAAREPTDPVPIRDLDALPER